MGHADFSHALLDPVRGPDDSLFGRFVGSWTLTCTEYDPDGTERTLPGEWHWAWVLAGRAIQDVWVLPGVEHGASLRFPDPADPAVWRSTWIGPVRGRVQTFLARATERGGAVLEGDGLRWTFSDVTPEAFSWRNEIREADGGWRVQQTMDVHRPD